MAILRKSESIREFLGGVGWIVIKQWIDHEGFPAVRIGNEWYATEHRIIQWLDEKIDTDITRRKLLGLESKDIGTGSNEQTTSNGDPGQG